MTLFNQSYNGMVTAKPGGQNQAVTMMQLESKLETIKRAYSLAYDRRNELTRKRITLQLEGVCNGTRYQRDLSGGGVALYANHASGSSCPLHGDPPMNNRLRVYVGKYGEQKAADCVAAMERYTQADRLLLQEKELNKLMAELDKMIDWAEWTARRWLEVTE